MKKFLVLLIVSMATLLASAQNKSKDAAPVQDTTVKPAAQPPVPVFVLQGSLQDFLTLKSALVTLKLYAKQNAPDVQAPELVEWIDKQLEYQVKLLQEKKDPPKH